LFFSHYRYRQNDLKTSVKVWPFWTAQTKKWDRCRQKINFKEKEKNGGSAPPTLWRQNTTHKFLSFSRLPFSYIRKVYKTKKRKERHTKYLWRLMLIIYGAKNTVLRIQHSPFSKQFTALKTVHMKILRFLFSYGVNHFLNMGRTPWIHIYYNIEKTNHRCPTEVW
jgi:hypothetical protein